ncbi:MAG: preprotein translocase subunit SecE [Proteobacteria bacterium]|nr:preprotein translocase subunit SecE [Pseudomonadota bacterium]MBU1583816.1 preprotein translocase subunit SecE [Pseudomonadota bacterium]MBU2627236.1 preprotein translocase subunit SecE [Pseudomonadota bacterium]
MSRLLKKKPVGEKKKQRDASSNDTDSTVSSANFSSAKSATVASPLKAKLEKSLTDTKTGEPNFFQKAMEFLREVKVELKKVTWPTRKQTTGTTIVVIVFVFVVAAFLGLFDLGLSKLVQVVLT